MHATIIITPIIHLFNSIIVQLGIQTLRQIENIGLINQRENKNDNMVVVTKYPPQISLRLPVVRPPMVRLLLVRPSVELSS